MKPLILIEKVIHLNIVSILIQTNKEAILNDANDVTSYNCINIIKYVYYTKLYYELQLEYLNII